MLPAWNLTSVLHAGAVVWQRPTGQRRFHANTTGKKLPSKITMITKAFVEPAYKSIRLMDLTHCIPLFLDTKTGKFHFKPQLRSRIIHWLICSLAALKTLHILYALVKLTTNFTPSSYPTLILTICVFSLCGTSVYWGWELFHRGVEETIILFNSLQYAPSPPPMTLQLEAGNVQKRRKLTKAHAKVASFRLLASVKASSALTSMTAQEILIVCTPFAVKLFLPLYMLMVIFFPHWDIFITSFVYVNGQKGWSSYTAFCIAFEAVAIFYVESNILFFFFFNLSLQLTHLIRVEMDVARMK